LGAGNVSSKPIAFRPTQKTNELIEKLLKEGKAKNKSDAINQLIGEAQTQPQLEHSEEEDYFTFPPFLYCPQANTWLSKDTLLNPRSESSCQKCKDQKRCSAWRLKHLF